MNQPPRKIRKIIGISNTFVKSEKIPNYDRSKYYTKPSYIEMCRMSENELSSVQNFTVGNDYGEIIFSGKSDIR